MRWRRVVSLCALAVAIRLVILALLPEGVWSYDLGAFQRVAEHLRAGKNPYAETALLNYPPLWMQILYVLDLIARVTTAPLYVILRIFLILVDAANLAIAYWIGWRFLALQNVDKLLLWGMALNPILILLVCQHGNFDPLVATIVLAFTAALLKFRETAEAVDWLFAALALGIGVLLKTAPFALVPMLGYGFRSVSRRARVLGAVLVVGPAAIGLSVIYVLSPAQVTAHVIKYHALAGWFGFTGLLALAGLSAVSAVYARIFPFVILAIATWATRRAMARAEVEPRALVLLVACILATIVAYGPGYGSQYIAWFTPLFVLTAGAFDQRWRSDLIVAWVAAILTYLVEYALLPSHGAFLVKALDQPSLFDSTAFLHEEGPSTLMRLPLFAAYLYIVHRGFGLLRGSYFVPPPR